MNLIGKKQKRAMVLIGLITCGLCCFSLLFSMYNSNKIIGYVEDNKIYYNNQIFVESFDTFDFEVGRCIGTVEWIEDNSRSRIYKIENQANYIYLSMTTDYRIYKLSN